MPPLELSDRRVQLVDGRVSLTEKGSVRVGIPSLEDHHRSNGVNDSFFGENVSGHDGPIDWREIAS